MAQIPKYEYKIVETWGRGAIGELESEVNALILCGWKPQGGVAVTHEMYRMDDDSMPTWYYTQAMIKQNWP